MNKNFTLKNITRILFMIIGFMSTYAFWSLEHNGDFKAIYIALLTSSLTLSIFLYGAIAPIINKGLSGYREQYNIDLRNKIADKWFSGLLFQTIIINALLLIFDLSLKTNFAQVAFSIVYTVSVYFIVIFWVYGLFKYRRINDTLHMKITKLRKLFYKYRGHKQLNKKAEKLIISEINSILLTMPKTQEDVKMIGMFNKALLFDYWKLVMQITSAGKYMFDRFKLGEKRNIQLMTKISKDDMFELDVPNTYYVNDLFIESFIDFFMSSSNDDQKSLMVQKTTERELSNMEYSYETLRFLVIMANTVDDSPESCSFFFVNFSAFLLSIQSMLSIRAKDVKNTLDEKKLKNIGIKMSKYNNYAFAMTQKMLADKKYVNKNDWYEGINNIWGAVIVQASFQFEYFLLHHNDILESAIDKFVNGKNKNIAILNISGITEILDTNYSLTQDNDAMKADCGQELLSFFNLNLKAWVVNEIQNLDFKDISFKINDSKKEELSLALVGIIIKNELYYNLKYLVDSLFIFLVERLQHYRRKAITQNGMRYIPALDLSHIVSPFIQATRFWLASEQYEEEELPRLKTRLRTIMSFDKNILRDTRPTGFGMELYKALNEKYNMQKNHEEYSFEEYIDLKDGLTKELLIELKNGGWK